MTDENNLSSSEGLDEGEDENVVTMVDVLKAEEIMEQDADAVLGPGDDKNCTYNEGYLKRQALYSCLTCLPADGKKSAGICLACSYQCHGNHDLVELYTKRNFRCDCGTGVFKDEKCKLDNLKYGLNEKNEYNKNFKGLYCSCDRPYPDPEDKEEDTMLQCIVCEDWFHTKHLGSTVPHEDEYSEMICGPCNDRLPFLQYYLGYSISKITSKDDKSEVDVVSSKDDKGEVDVVCSVSGEEELQNTSQPKNASVASLNEAKADSQNENIPEGQGVDSTTASSPIENSCEVQKSLETKEVSTTNSLTKEEVEPEKTNNGLLELKSEEDPKITSPPKKFDSTSEKGDSKDCLLLKLKALPRGKGATFWPEHLRSQFCTCSSCMEMYKKCNVPFITDEEDTVLAYEEGGKIRKPQAGATQYERGMKALNSLDRVQQMEAILGYNDMKSHLSEYLAKFVENKKVVREEDIREFFSGMQARKRQKLDIPHSCR